MNNLTPKGSVALFVRLFAIGLLIYLVRILLAEFSYFMYLDSFEFNYFVLVVVGFILFLVIFLWRFPLFVASKLVRFEELDSSDKRLTESGFYTLGFVLLGTWLFYLTLSDTAYWWSYIAAQKELIHNTYVLGAEEKALIFSTVFEFFMSLILIIGARKTAYFVQWLRKAKT